MTAAQALDILSDRYGFVGDYIPIEHWTPNIPFWWERDVHGVCMDDTDKDPLPLWRITYSVEQGPQDEVADYIVQHVIDTGYIDAEELVEIAGG